MGPDSPCPPQCPAGWGKMPKWRPATTLDSPTAGRRRRRLRPSIGNGSPPSPFSSPVRPSARIPPTRRPRARPRPPTPSPGPRQASSAVSPGRRRRQPRWGGRERGPRLRAPKGRPGLRRPRSENGLPRPRSRAASPARRAAGGSRDRGPPVPAPAGPVPTSGPPPAGGRRGWAREPREECESHRPPAASAPPPAHRSLPGARAPEPR